MPHDAYNLINSDARSPFLLTCDHATNHVPDSIGGTLGLPQAEMARHIAYDIGAAGVTRHLADIMDARAILANFSRLVIDPNRGADDPTLIMQVYDHTIVPGNRGLSGTDRTQRQSQLYAPYHNALEDQASRPGTIIVAIHSFTPRLKSRAPRPWHIGVLISEDGRFSDPLIDRLRAEDDLIVGINEPYAGVLKGDSLDQHAVGPGRPSVLLELRQDLIETPDQQKAWADRLAPLLDAARKDANL